MFYYHIYIYYIHAHFKFKNVVKLEMAGFGNALEMGTLELKLRQKKKYCIQLYIIIEFTMFFHKYITVITFMCSNSIIVLDTG